MRRNKETHRAAGSVGFRLDYLTRRKEKTACKR